MAIRDYVGLVLSIFVAGVMGWACSFEIQQIMMGELVTAAGGKYKFLTILNLVNIYLQFLCKFIWKI
jgi:hypothetical protein